MAELKKIKLALKFAIRKNQQTFLLEIEDWETFDRIVFLLLAVAKDFGFTKQQTISLFEETKREVEEELKNG